MNRSIFALILGASLLAAPPTSKPAKKAKPAPVEEQSAESTLPPPPPPPPPATLKPKITKVEVMKAGVMASYTAEQEIMLDGAKSPLLTCKILLAWHRDLAERWERERVVRVKRHYQVAMDAVTTPALNKYLPQTEAAMIEAELTRNGFRAAVKALTELKGRIEAEEVPSEMK